jgi:hypothetical protein
VQRARGSAAADHDTDPQYDGAAQRHDDQRGSQRYLQEPVSDPRDHEKLDAHDDPGDDECSIDETDHFIDALIANDLIFQASSDR